MNWLADNKEWLFSGVGLVVLIGLGKFLRRTFSSPNPRTGISNSKGGSATSSEPPDLSQNQSPEAAQSAVEGQVVDLTPPEIFAYLEDLPDLQKPDAAEHYRGIHVRWEGEVAHIRQREDEVEVMLCYAPELGPYYYFHFRIDPEDYPGLGLLKSGEAALTVEGVINQVSLPETGLIELTEARILDGL